MANGRIIYTVCNNCNEKIMKKGLKVCPVCKSALTYPEPPKRGDQKNTTSSPPKPKKHVYEDEDAVPSESDAITDEPFEETQDATENEVETDEIDFDEDIVKDANLPSEAEDADPAEYEEDFDDEFDDESFDEADEFEDSDDEFDADDVDTVDANGDEDEPDENLPESDDEEWDERENVAVSDSSKDDIEDDEDYSENEWDDPEWRDEPEYSDGDEENDWNDSEEEGDEEEYYEEPEEEVEPPKAMPQKPPVRSNRKNKGSDTSNLMDAVRSGVRKPDSVPSRHSTEKLSHRPAATSTKSKPKRPAAEASVEEVRKSAYDPNHDGYYDDVLTMIDDVVFKIPKDIIIRAIFIIGAVLASIIYMIYNI